MKNIIHKSKSCKSDLKISTFQNIVLKEWKEKQHIERKDFQIMDQEDFNQEYKIILKTHKEETNISILKSGQKMETDTSAEKA